MTLPGDVDPTRRHASVTAVLAAVAALVFVLLEDPAQRKVAGPGGLAAGTTAPVAHKPLPLARQARYRQFDSPARLLIRPSVMGSTTPVLPRKE